MQKKNSFTRITSGLLALVMVIGMIPMGLVRPVEAAVSEYQVIDSAATGIYEKVSWSTLYSDYTAWNNNIYYTATLLLGLGGYIISEADETSLKLVSMTPEQLKGSNLYSYDATDCAKWTVTCGEGYQAIYTQYVEENGWYMLGANDDNLPVLAADNKWGFVDNTVAVDDYALALVYSKKESESEYVPWIAYQENGAVAVKQTDWGSYTTGGEETFFYVYAPVTTVYAALNTTNTYSVEANSVTTSDLLAKIKDETFVNISSDSAGTDAASYDLNTTTVGNYAITTEWDKELDTATAGTYTMTVSANNVALGTVTVEVTAPASPYAVTVGNVGNLNIDGTATASATVTNDGQTVDSSNYTLVWSSGNTAVATVNSSTGEITAVAPGTATITAEATLTDGTMVSGTTQVTVNVPSVSISFADTTASVEVGKTVTLTPTVTVKAGETVLENVNYTLAWESSSTGNATVSDGTVTGVAEGSANITATVETITVGGVTVTLDSKPSAAVAVTVEASKEPTLTLNKTETTLSVNGNTSETITATVANSTETAITWSSGNSAVATVDNNGLITAVASGTAEITATLNGVTDSEGKAVTATVTVTVTAPVVLDVTSSELTLGAGASSDNLAYSITHNNAAVSNPTATITWTSDKPGVATVDANGKITAIAGGTATITATLTGLKDSNGDDILLTDANSDCEDTVNVTVIGITVESVDRVTLQITEEEPNPKTTIVLNSTTVPSGLTSVITVDTTDLDSSVAEVSYNAETKTVTITANSAGNTSFKAVATYTDSDGNTYTGEKVIYIKVQAEDPLTLVSNWLAVDEGEDIVKFQKLSYIDLGIDISDILICSGNVAVSYDGTEFVFVDCTITGPDADGYYTVSTQDGDTIKLWNRNYWGGIYYVEGDKWYYIRYVDDTGVVIALSGGYDAFDASQGTTDGAVRFTCKDYSDNYYSLCVTNGKVEYIKSTGAATTDAKADLNVYQKVTLKGEPTKAAIYAKNYVCDVTDYSTAYFNDILSECEVWLDTDGDGEADETYALNNLPSGYKWELIPPSSTGTGTGTVDSITTTGVYTVKVTGPDPKTGATQVLGTFTITIEAPKSITLTIDTDGTLDASGNLSLGTGKTANATPVLTVTMADGWVVPATMLEGEITVTETDHNNYIAFENGVVTGSNSGSASITATLGSSLKINGLEVLNAVSDKKTSATLNVNVFQINYVNLDTSEVPGAVTIDVADEGETDSEITLSYLTVPANINLPDGVSVSYDYAISDPNGTGIECEIADGKLTIFGADAKGTATVTVKLILNEDPDNAAWETGTVTERQITVNVTHNALEPYEITVSPDSVLTGVDHTKNLQATVTQGTNVIENPSITWSTNNNTVATVDENGVVTGVAVGTATVTATVSYTLNGESKTATCQVSVKVAGTEELYEMTVIPDKLAMDVGDERTLTAIVTYEGEIIAPDIVWSVTGDCVTVSADGTVRAVGFGTASVTASAVVGKDANGNEIVKEVSVPITIAEPELELGQNFKVSQGSVITVTPYVNLKNEFSSYEVTWQVTSGDGVVTLGGTTTVGGPQAENASGVQYIKDALNSITASTSATGTATVEAWLSKLNGVEVSGEHDSITVEVVPTALNLKNEYLANHNSALTTLDPNSSYQFLLKDAHTFQEIVNAGTSDEITDVNGLDARVTAVVGDNHIDFSNVTAYVYKDGQIVLDDSGKPIVIPASDLIFYNVETDEVGWHEVRVTYKDYYYTHLDQTLDDGSISKVPVYKYEEYEVGTVWMYVREPVSVTESMTANVILDTTYYKTNQINTEDEFIIVGVDIHNNDTRYALRNASNTETVSPVDGKIKASYFSNKELDLNYVEWTFVAQDNGTYKIKCTTKDGQEYYLGVGDESSVPKVTNTDKADTFAIEQTEGGIKLKSTAKNDYLVYHYGYKYGGCTDNENEAVFEIYKKVVISDMVAISANITDIRPWVGAGTSSFVENSAHLTPLAPESDGNVYPYYFDVSFSFTYNGQTYSFSDASDYITHEVVGGNLTAVWTGSSSGAIKEYGKEKGNHFSGMTATELGKQYPALGYITIVLTEVQVDGLTVELAAPLTVQVPIVVREDTVKIDRVTTFGCNDKAGGRWGGTQSYGFKYWLGGGPTSAYFSGYAMEYVSDLVEGRFDVGINDFGKTSGIWHEYLTVNAPLGTGNVISYLHSITESDGTVLILDEGDRTLDTADYAINVDPEMIILKEHGSSLQYPTEGTVQATITDDKGNRITTDAKVKWIMRNSSISGVVGQQLTYPKGDPLDGYFNEEVPADANGRTDTYTVTSVNSGVTYITAQLMEVKVDGEWVDVSGYYIADYCIIYVVDDDEELESVDIVFDYGKPIEIDYDKLSYTKQITDENGNVVETIEYEFAGFADTEHPMRKHAYTTYGEIEYFDGTDPDVIYTPLDIVDSVETVYAILQVKGTNNQWVFHKIHIIPATVVYYETDGNVAPAYNYTGSWATTGSYKEGLQDDYRSESNGGKEIYGYDSSYDDDAHLSNESSLFVHGMSTASGVVSGEPETSASFSFTGTGFDIIARTNMNQATLRVHVVNQETKAKKIVSVICKGTNELYQIPVISVKGLDYGTYKVEIIVYEAYDPRKVLDEDTQKVFGETTLDRLTRGDEFHFDAIRIYDPVKGNAIAEAAYKSDGEYAQTITQIGKQLIDQQTFEKTAIGEQQVIGAVFMDSYTLSVGDKIQSGTGGFVTTTDVATYDKVGPNNEVYLGKDQGIAFILNTNGTMPASIQIGAKSITGDPVTLNAKLVKATTANNNTTYAATNHTLEQPINTCTAMYYELLSAADSVLFADGNQVYVVIWNTGDTVLSITDIKFAYKEATAQAVEFLYSAELASVAAATISEYEDQTYLKRIGEDWCYCDSNGEVIVYSGLVQTQDSGIWYVVNGKVDFSYNGLYRTEAGERYSVRSGRVETTLNGIAERDGQWLYFTAGRVDTDFTGIASYGDSGEWYVLNGEVQVSNSETITLNGVTYNLENGKVISNS